MKKLTIGLVLGLMLIPFFSNAQVVGNDPALQAQLENQIRDLTIQILLAQIAQLQEQIRLIMQERGLTEEPIKNDPTIFDTPAFGTVKDQEDKKKEDLKSCLTSARGKRPQISSAMCYRAYGN